MANNKIYEYETKLNEFQNLINDFSEKVDKAEKDKIVAQTKIDTYVSNLRELENHCMVTTGRPIQEIDSVLQESMESIEKIIAQINEVLQESK